MTEPEIIDIDKSSWTLVKFGDVVFEPKDTCKDLVKGGISHVVGLEHIIAEDIHLRNSATIEESTTFTKKFEVGDVLFGRRRAYLKKAAQAAFNGVCSGDITVFRANKSLIPELLPFIVNNDRFFDYAIKHSAGGLSPRVKFKDLTKYEFLLPPIEEQKELAELLWAMDEVIQMDIEVLDKLKVVFKSNRKGFIEQGLNRNDSSKKLRFGKVSSRWRVERLGNFCKLIGGNAFKSAAFLNEGKFQVLRIGNITDFGFDFSKSPVYLDSISSSEEKYLIPKDAVLLSLTGTNGKRDYGFPLLMEDHNKYLLNQRLVMLIPDNKIMIPEFLFLLAKLELFQGRFFLQATGTANQANVSIKDISEIELPVPSLSEQIEIVKNIKMIRLAIQASEAKVSSSKALHKSLINQIFG